VLKNKLPLACNVVASEGEDARVLRWDGSPLRLQGRRHHAMGLAYIRTIVPTFYAFFVCFYLLRVIFLGMHRRCKRGLQSSAFFFDQQVQSPLATCPEGK